jgi:hypothetical protein
MRVIETQNNRRSEIGTEDAVMVNHVTVEIIIYGRNSVFQSEWE